VLADITEVDELSLSVDVGFLVSELEHLHTLERLPGILGISAAGHVAQVLLRLLPCIVRILWEVLSMHLLNGFFYQGLSSLEQVEVLDLNRVRCLALGLGLFLDLGRFPE